jgi:hypothetical protein
MARSFTGGVFMFCAGSLLAGGLLSGCDLIDFAQNPSVRFKLPPRTYELSTNDPSWKSPPAFFNAAISCTTDASCCPPPGSPAGFDPPECKQLSFVCAAGQCGIQFPLEVTSTIDLAKEAPALAGMNSKVVSEITLESLEYKITNQVGTEFPPVKLYIAPAATKTATGTGAQFISETPKAPAGVVTTDTRTTAPEARTAFSTYAKDLKPFNFIASTSVSILSGAMPPNGKVTLEVTGTVIAKF